MECEYELMTKADKYLVESIYNILQNGIKDENPRPKVIPSPMIVPIAFPPLSYSNFWFVFKCNKK